MKWVLVIFHLSALNGSSGWQASGEFDAREKCESQMAGVIANHKGKPDARYPSLSIGRHVWAECIADDVWAAHNKELWHKFNKTP
jgi:hypothetical protein